MKITFEKWIEENEIPDTAKDLFRESIICYKVSAYRSAFIMSYIAFQNILKERILNASYRPTRVNESHWSSICRKLGDEDKWDETVSNCVKQQSPDRIFLVTNSIVT